MSFNKEGLMMISKNDVTVLEEKGKVYGDSWKKRGGVGAFMMLARKWDRIENQMQSQNYDVFKCDLKDKDGLLDDIQDLRRYLLLVECEINDRYFTNHIANRELKPGQMPMYESVPINFTGTLESPKVTSSENPYANIND